jgi:hypothetical protein
VAGHVGDALVAQEPQHQDGALCRGEAVQRGPQHLPVLEAGHVHRLLQREVAGQAHLPPATAAVVEEGADQDPVHVPVDVVGPGDPRPLRVHAGQRLLHQVVGLMRVAAERVGPPSQHRHPPGGVGDEVVHPKIKIRTVRGYAVRRDPFERLHTPEPRDAPISAG